MSQNEAPSAAQHYGELFQRRSLDDPHRIHRRSSIPFADRKPAVRFTRVVETKSLSQAGPNKPCGDCPVTIKPILKKTGDPIRVSTSSHEFYVGATNDELESCRETTEKILEQLSRADRVARGSMDILTFPCSTPRIQILSRFFGCLTVGIGCIHFLVTSRDFAKELALILVALTKEMSAFAKALHISSKKLLAKTMRRYREADAIFMSNSEFKVVRTELAYPLYTHRRMPESVSVYEEFDNEETAGLSSQVRICRPSSDESISCHFDTSAKADFYEAVDIEQSPLLIKQEMAKFVIIHGRGILRTSNKVLDQCIEMITDKELKTMMDILRDKLTLLDYDERYDPLCSLELKNVLGELVDKESELLNTARQIVSSCQQVKTVTALFYRYTKRKLKLGCVCWPGVSNSSILNRLRPFSVEDIKLILPMSKQTAVNIFNVEENSGNPSDSSLYSSVNSVDTVASE